MSTKIISWKRFWLYLKQYVFVNVKTWLLSSLVVIGLMVIFFLLTLNHLIDAKEHLLIFFNNISEHSTFFYYIGLYVTGLILTLTSFNNFSSKQSGTFSLLLPATTFEKLLAHWTVTVPAFMIFYQVLWLVASIFMNYFAGLISGLHLGLFVPVWKNAFVSGNDFINYLIIYLLVQSVFFAGTALTGKKSFIKTTIAVLAVLFIIALLNRLIDSTLFGDKNYFSYSRNFKLYSASLHLTVLNYILMPILLLLLPVCYLVSYYFLKEKEV